jgi:hypothetical protein
LKINFDKYENKRYPAFMSLGKILGGLFGSVAAWAGVLFMKCPLCWLAMGTATAASKWPYLLLPTAALVVFKLRSRAACCKT